MPDDAGQREYSIPRGVRVNVQEGERVRPGEPLMDGPRDPHDILKVLGARELQLELDREMEYFVEPEEAIGAHGVEPVE